jgi:hypothetical protein
MKVRFCANAEKNRQTASNIIEGKLAPGRRHSRAQACGGQTSIRASIPMGDTLECADDFKCVPA